MIKKMFVPIILILLVMAGAGCAPATPIPTEVIEQPTEETLLPTIVPPTPTPEPINVVMIKAGDFIAFGPMYIALANGYFAEEGLNLELTNVAGGPVAIAALMAGDADFSIGTTSQYLPAIHQGMEVKFLVPVTGQLQVTSVIRNEYAAEKGITADSPLTDKIQAMVGAKIGVTSVGGGIEKGLRAILAEYKIDPNTQVEILAIGSDPSAWVAAVTAGQIDIAFISSPLPETIADQGVAIPFISLTRGDVPSLSGILDEVFSTSTAFAESHPEAVKAFIKAITRAQQFIVNNPEEAKQVMYEYAFSALSEKVFSDAFDTFFGAFYATPILNESDYQRALVYVSVTQGTVISAPAEEVFMQDLAIEVVNELGITP